MGGSRAPHERVHKTRQVIPISELVVATRVRGATLAIGDVFHRPSFQEIVCGVAESPCDMMDTLGRPPGLISESGDAFLESLDVFLIAAGGSERDREKHVWSRVDSGQTVSYEMDDGCLVAFPMD